MESIFSILLSIVILTLTILYLDGYFGIKSIEEVERNTYKITKTDRFTNGKEESKETYIVYKYTYKSGRIKFKTKSFKY